MLCDHSSSANFALVGRSLTRSGFLCAGDGQNAAERGRRRVHQYVPTPELSGYDLLCLIYLSCNDMRFKRRPKRFRSGGAGTQ
eukprot:5667111-Pyramimonas_sp.AAC.1